MIEENSSPSKNKALRLKRSPTQTLIKTLDALGDTPLGKVGILISWSLLMVYFVLKMMMMMKELELFSNLN